MRISACVVTVCITDRIYIHLYVNDADAVKTIVVAESVGVPLHDVLAPFITREWRHKASIL